MGENEAPAEEMTADEKSTVENGVGDPTEELILVGIGASAGGFEALRILLPTLPSRANFSYVIAQHLDPKHQSLLASLLDRHSAMEVREIENGQPPQADVIHITPSGFDVTLRSGRLALGRPPEGPGPKPSVDLFFTSLAEEKKDRAIGIVLSGTGSDGAHGLRAIKAGGGLAIVQEPESARYDGMPRSAIDTGLVDMVLPPERIGPELLTITRYPDLIAGPERPDAPEALEHIFHLLATRIGVDFSEYKRSTLQRRIGRRMALQKIVDFNDYARHLEVSHHELEILYKDILISVTSFFRDREAYEALRKLLPQILGHPSSPHDPPKGTAPRRDIRIWVPGCASGEEAYSIAILVAEYLGDRLPAHNVQIFGSDLDAEAVERARRGLYPQAALAKVDDAIRERYFVSIDDMFQVAKEIREMIVFARQDVIKDPPFSHLQLISCRNLLIYFDTSLQQRILPMFHYVLESGGHLFLGKSETIGPFADLFTPVSKKWKIYRRRRTTAPLQVQVGFPRKPQPGLAVSPRRSAVKPRITLRDTMHDAIAEVYGQCGVLVDKQLNVRYVRGDVSPYLRLAEGDVEVDILKLARDEVRLHLRTVVHKALRVEKTVRSQPFKVTRDDEEVWVSALATPNQPRHEGEPFVLVLFEELPAPSDTDDDARPRDDADPRIVELEHELAASREHLQTTIEELETTNEELQSLNEEMQSANEELQSSNEELETSNEELQSTNEELTTVNEELSVKTSELAAANADLENVITKMGMAVVLVDQNLRVTRYNPLATEVFDLGASDLGQLLTAIPCRVDLQDLREKLLQVVASGEEHSEEIKTDQRIYHLRISPYLGNRRRISGAVLMLMDQTQVRGVERELREKNEKLEQLREALRDSREELKRQVDERAAADEDDSGRSTTKKRNKRRG